MCRPLAEWNVLKTEVKDNWGSKKQQLNNESIFATVEYKLVKGHKSVLLLCIFFHLTCSKNVTESTPMW